MATSFRIFRKWWLLLPAAFVLAALLAALYLYYWPQAAEDRIRQSVVHALAERFRSDVALQALHIKVFPLLHVTGENLTLRYHGRTDVPPLLHIASFSFSAGISGLLHPVKRIPLLRVQNMLINIPPRDPNQLPSVPGNPHTLSSPLNIVVDRVLCDDTVLRVLSAKPGKDPLEWDIHNLVLTSADATKPFAFRGTLSNAKPSGEIATHGQFGPWDVDDPGSTPVSGEYSFTNANLGPLPGIAGILSSNGKYTGVLSELQVDGQTDTPDFSLDKVGRPIPLHTEFSATVDGTNGDTYLHPVTATLNRSLIIAEGRVVRVPHKPGHLISIDASVPAGRVQDFLALATASQKPVFTGPVRIKAKLTILPGSEHVIERIILDGQFGVQSANWSDPALREKLESLSRHAQGKPGDEDIGSSVSDLNGSFLLQNGVFHFRRLTFTVEGAAIDLTGTYVLRSGELDLNGHLSLQAKLSQTLGGSRSLFLKAFDPFFEKNGSGTVLPIKITGTRENPVFSVTVFHKTFDKQLGDEKHKL